MKPAKSGKPDLKLYALVGGVLVLSLGYAFWPSIQGQNSEATELLQALLKENERLRGNAVTAPVVAVAPVVRVCADGAPTPLPARPRGRYSHRVLL